MTDFINNGTANQLKIGKAVVYVISDWQMFCGCRFRMMEQFATGRRLFQSQRAAGAGVDW